MSSLEGTATIRAPGRWQRLEAILGHPLVGLLVRLAVGGVFLYAGYQKASDITTFVWTVEDYQFLPRAWADAYARALPYGEIVVGLFLVVGLMPRLAGALACLMTLSFVVAMGQALVRGISLNCGCFGPATEPLTWWTVIRDLPLLAGAVHVYLWGEQSHLAASRYWRHPPP